MLFDWSKIIEPYLVELSGAHGECATFDVRVEERVEESGAELFFYVFLNMKVILGLLFRIAFSKEVVGP